jgi:putative effector of murein hydrolase LrgA (UPF0299 family)
LVPFDAFGLAACLLGGLWIWRRLRILGIDPLAAAVLSLLSLWLLGCLVSPIYLALCRAMQGLADSGWPIALTLVASTLATAGAIAGRFWWTHWRARQFFDR